MTGSGNAQRLSTHALTYVVPVVPAQALIPLPSLKPKYSLTSGSRCSMTVKFNVDTVFFDYVTADEVKDAAELEKKAFPPDEADNPEQFRYRFTHAKHLFLGAFIPSRSSSGQMKEGRKLIGHVCGTQSPLTYYAKESMSSHIPFSPSICIHSVCLLESYRKKGIGSRMMREFISRVRSSSSKRSGVVNLIEGKPERFLLLSHGETRRFYEKLGFVCKGKSDVVLGREVWYEMSFNLERN